MIATTMWNDGDHVVLFFEVLAWGFIWGLGFALWEKSFLAPKRRLSSLIAILVPGILAGVFPVVILACERFAGDEIEVRRLVIACGLSGVLFGLSAVAAGIGFQVCRRVLRARFTS